MRYWAARLGGIRKIGHGTNRLYGRAPLIAALRRKCLKCASRIDFEAEFDRLAADLAVLDVACGAGTRVNWRLEALAAIRALDQVKLHAARSAAIRGYARVDHWLETVLRINALRIAQFHVALG